MLPPCAVTSSWATARPSPVPPLRAEPWKAWNRWVRAFSGTPGPSSRTTMVTRRPLRRPPTSDVALDEVLLLDGLQGVAAQIGQHAEQLVAIGVDAQRLVDVDGPGDGTLARQAQAVADLLDQRAQTRSARGAAAPPRRART